MLRLTVMMTMLCATIALWYVSAMANGVSTEPPVVLIAFEPENFAPLRLTPHPSACQGFNLIIPGELERTPRDYAKVTAAVKATGATKATLALVDILNREYKSDTLKLKKDQAAEIGIDMATAGRPISMLRTVRMYVEGAPLDVSSLRMTCAIEKLPEPDVTVQGPMDDTSIQAALNSLGEDGGVVYIPAGTYLINNQVTIPCDNVTVYGDGTATIIQGTWYDAKALFIAVKRSNLRLTRLSFRSLPITEFRGYNEKQHAKRPEDVDKPCVLSRGIELSSCQNVRVDHCEIALFGHAGVAFYGGTENLVDHCFLRENFRYGYGYGVATPGTKELYIEDNNFENHRHGIAGNAGGASYIARFNRLVKYAKLFPSWNQSPDGINQLRAHEIDAHDNCGWIYAHDNFVAMYDAVMGAGAMMRGNQGWLYRNVFESCSPGIMCIGDSDDVWAWDNVSDKPDTLYVNSASGAIHFDEKPPNFAEFPYPYALNRPGWWPGADEGCGTISRPDTQFAGPTESLVLRSVGTGQ